MTQEEYIDSKVTTMTDLSGKKSKVLLLKNETEIESFKKQLALCNVVGRSEQFYCAPYATGDKPNRCRRQCYECKTEPKQ